MGQDRPQLDFHHLPVMLNTSSATHSHASRLRPLLMGTFFLFMASYSHLPSLEGTVLPKGNEKSAITNSWDSLFFNAIHQNSCVHGVGAQSSF